MWGWLEPPERIAFAQPPDASVADADPDAHHEPPNQSGADADLDVNVHVLDDERHEDLHHKHRHVDVDYDHDAGASYELSQLGHRVQHAVRAFTPKDAKALKSAVETFPTTTNYELAETLAKRVS